MDIESILLSKNRDAFDRIMTMMRSLIVKNEVEADAAETTESLEAFNSYARAYEENDSILDYVFYESDLLASGFTTLEAEEYLIYPKKLQTLAVYGDTKASSFLAKLRKTRIDTYVENNIYYRPFCGLPSSKDEFININNTDKVLDSDPDTIYLHEVIFTNYPKTYNRLFYEREIDAVYENFDYMYLQFIENPLIPYVVRNKKQFEICYYNSSALNSKELPYFFDAYNVARNEILLIDYIEAFQETYSAYVDVMFLFILYYTFNLYCAKTLERYSVRDYTDDEILDVLDSNGLSNLKHLNMGILRNIVKRLPDIQANLGTQNIIDIIFDIVADKTLTAKRYYLNKKYNIDGSGNTVIVENGLYNDNVDLTFIEKTVKRGSEATFASDGEYSYDEIVIQDDTWGGTSRIDDMDAKADVKRAMKTELLAANFSSITTKYLSLSKVIDMYTKLVDTTDKLGLFYQINEARSNFLKEDTVIFNGSETTALSIYAAWCYLYGMLNGLDDPDYIIQDIQTLEGIMKLRKSDKIHIDALELGNAVVDLGNGYNRTLSYYFTQEELQKYLVNFNYDANTSIETIVAQYDDNFEIITAIKEKLNKTSDYEEYSIWETILKANITSQNINSLFQGYTTYTSYIKNRDMELYRYLEAIVTGGNVTTSKTLIKEACDALKDSYTSYVSDVSNETVQIMAEESDASEGESLENIAVLFNEFMSCYTQLFKQDFHVGYDNPSENSLTLLYAKCMENFITNDTDTLDLVQKLLTDTLYGSEILANLELLHYIKDMLQTEDSDELVLAIEQIYELIKMSLSTHLTLDYKAWVDTLKDRVKTELCLESVIISNKELD